MSTFNGYTIFEKIQFLASKRGKPIRQIAIEAGFKSPNAIYRYKQGVTPRNTSIEAIAKVLNTTPEYLKGQTDDWQILDEETSQEDKAHNEAEQNVLNMFRKSTEGMNEDEKLRFQQSLSKLMDVAKDFNQGK